MYFERLNSWKQLILSSHWASHQEHQAPGEGVYSLPIVWGHSRPHSKPKFTAVKTGGPTWSQYADSCHLPASGWGPAHRDPTWSRSLGSLSLMSSSVEVMETTALLQPRGGGTSKSLMGFNRPWNCWQEEGHFHMADWTVILAQTGTSPNCDVPTREQQCQVFSSYWATKPEFKPRLSKSCHSFAGAVGSCLFPFSSHTQHLKSHDSQPLG